MPVVAEGAKLGDVAVILRVSGDRGSRVRWGAGVVIARVQDVFPRFGDGGRRRREGIRPVAGRAALGSGFGAAKCLKGLVYVRVACVVRLHRRRKNRLSQEIPRWHAIVVLARERLHSPSDGGQVRGAIAVSQFGWGRRGGGFHWFSLFGGLEAFLYILPRVDFPLGGATLLHGRPNATALKVDKCQEILVVNRRHFDSKWETCVAQKLSS